MAVMHFKGFGELTVLYAEHAGVVHRFVRSFRADVDAFLHAVRGGLELTLGQAIGERVTPDGATEWAVGSSTDGPVRVLILIDRHSPAIVWPGELRLSVHCNPAELSLGHVEQQRRVELCRGGAAPAAEEIVIRLQPEDPVGSAVDAIPGLVRRLQRATKANLPLPTP